MERFKIFKFGVLDKALEEINAVLEGFFRVVNKASSSQFDIRTNTITRFFTKVETNNFSRVFILFSIKNIFNREFESMEELSVILSVDNGENRTKNGSSVLGKKRTVEFEDIRIDEVD